jgi:hypothetical protein
MPEKIERSTPFDWLGNSAAHDPTGSLIERRAQIRPLTSTGKPKRRRKRPGKSHQNPETQACYKRIREFGKNGVQAFVKRADAAQRPFPIPEKWTRKGCPRSLVAAYRAAEWKEKIESLYQNAWRGYRKPGL